MKYRFSKYSEAFIKILIQIERKTDDRSLYHFGQSTKFKKPTR